MTPNRPSLYLLVPLLALFLYGCGNITGKPSVYLLTTNISPSDGGTVTPSDGEFNEGSMHQIEANPATGFIFQGWEGDLEGSDNPASITFNSDKNVTALFIERFYPLTIEIEGTGSVREEIVETLASTDYQEGTVVRLTAEPGDGWLFMEWEEGLEGSENPQTITIEDSTTVRAIFSLEEDEDDSENGNGNGDDDDDNGNGNGNGDDDDDDNGNGNGNGDDDDDDEILDFTVANVTIVQGEPLQITITAADGSTLSGSHDVVVSGLDGLAGYTGSASLLFSEVNFSSNSATINVLNGTTTASLEGQTDVTLNAAIGEFNDDFLVTVTPAPDQLLLGSGNPPDGQVGESYTHSFSATGGDGSYTYSITAGAFPGGLSLNGSTGLLSGTPTEDGDFSFTIQVTDGEGETDSGNFNLTIDEEEILDFTVANVTIVQGEPLQITITAADGSTLSGSHDVVVSGLNGLAGYTGSASLQFNNVNFSSNSATINVLDGVTTADLQGQTDVTLNAAIGEFNDNFLVTVTPALDPLVLGGGSLSEGQVGESYTHSFTATGGDGSYTYSIAAGAFPGGLSLNGSTGLLSGTPTEDGSFSFTIQVTDGEGETDSGNFNLTIEDEEEVEIVGISVEDVTIVQGEPLQITITASNGSNIPGSHDVVVSGLDGLAGYTGSASLLFNNINFNPNSATIEVLNGMTTADLEGQSGVTLIATLGEASDEFLVTVTLALEPLVFSGGSLPGGQVGESYTHTFMATGGDETYTYSIIGGQFPDGLTLDGSTGLLSGTPTEDGNFSFTVQVTDGQGTTNNGNFNLTIEDEEDDEPED